MTNFDENEAKMKNKSHRYDLNGIRSRHGHKYAKYKVCLSIMILCISNRSSHQRCSVIKDVLRNFGKFTGKHLCQSLFFLNKEHL